MRVNIALERALYDAFALAAIAAERERTLDRTESLTHGAVLRRVPKSKRR